MHADVVTLDWGEGPVINAPQSLVFDNDGYAPEVLEVVQTATSAFGCESKSIVNHTVYPKVTAAFLPPESACAVHNHLGERQHQRQRNPDLGLRRWQCSIPNATTCSRV